MDANMTSLVWQWIQWHLVPWLHGSSKFFCAAFEHFQHLELGYWLEWSKAISLPSGHWLTLAWLSLHGYLFLTKSQKPLWNTFPSILPISFLHFSKFWKFNFWEFHFSGITWAQISVIFLYVSQTYLWIMFTFKHCLKTHLCVGNSCINVGVHIHVRSPNATGNMK